MNTGWLTHTNWGRSWYGSRNKKSDLGDRMGIPELTVVGVLTIVVWRLLASFAVGMAARANAS
jgi:hypothetical protein